MQASERKIRELEGNTRWMDRQLEAAKRSVKELESMADQLEHVRETSLLLQMPNAPVICKQGAGLGAAGDACALQVLDNRQVDGRSTILAHCSAVIDP